MVLRSPDRNVLSLSPVVNNLHCMSIAQVRELFDRSLYIALATVANTAVNCVFNFIIPAYFLRSCINVAVINTAFRIRRLRARATTFVARRQAAVYFVACLDSCLK